MGANVIQKYTRQGRGIAGFMLLEMTLALLIFSALMGIQMRKDFNDLLDLKAKNVAKNIVTLQSALNDTLGTHYSEFNNLPTGVAPIVLVGAGANNSDVTIADAWRPTIANLVALGKLPATFSAKSAAGGSYKIQLQSIPVGCIAPACNIEGIIVIDSPFMINGVVDETRAGLAVRNIGSDGAKTSLENKSTLSGLNGQWAIPLPPTVAPARALVGVRVGYSSAVWGQFFRKDGSVAMTGNANFGGYGLGNVKQILSTLKAVDDPCLPAENGSIASGVINGNGTVMVCKNSQWKMSGSVTAVAGSVCSPDGSTATSSTTNEQLVCKNGKFVKLVNLIAKNVEVSRLLVTDGSVVNKPVCDVGGVPDYSFNMNQTAIDVTVAPPLQAQRITTTDLGGAWNVVLVLRTDTGTEVSGNNYSLSAVMHLECKY